MADPTAPQIETVREIAGSKSLADITTRVARLTSDQWDRTLEDITAWNEVRFSNVEIVGQGVTIKPQEKRATIRREVRTRLGLPEFVGLDLPQTGRSETKAIW